MQEGQINNRGAVNLYLFRHCPFKIFWKCTIWNKNILKLINTDFGKGDFATTYRINITLIYSLIIFLKPCIGTVSCPSTRSNINQRTHLYRNFLYSFSFINHLYACLSELEYTRDLEQETVTFSFLWLCTFCYLLKILV